MLDDDTTATPTPEDTAAGEAPADRSSDAPGDTSPEDGSTAPAKKAAAKRAPRKAPAKKAAAAKAPAKRATRKAAAADAGQAPVEGAPTDQTLPGLTDAPAAETAAVSSAETAAVSSAEDAEQASAPAKKAAARKTAAKRAPRKATAKKAAAEAPADLLGGAAADAADVVTTDEDEEAAAEAAAAEAALSGTTPAATSAVAPPVVLFQPPDTARATPARRTRKTAATRAAEAAAAAESAESPTTSAEVDGADVSADDTAAPAPVKRTSRRRTSRTAAAEPAAEETDSEPTEPTEPGAEQAEDQDDRDDSGDNGEAGGNGRRRRRRGGRRRRKGGNGEDGADAEGSEEETGSPANGQGGQDRSPNNRSGQGGSNGSNGANGANGEKKDEDAEAEGTSTRRRRRRRRSGDEGDSGDEPENTVTRVRRPRNPEDEITALSGSTRLEAKKQRRREGREAGRRRAPIVSEAEFLARREAVDRVMVIRQKKDLTQIAVLEDKVLVEHYVARESQTSLIGNVYLGKVQNVLPSMEAAFIDIGKGRNAVLYAGEVNWDTLGAGNGPRKIEQVLKSGQSVLVQVSKDPIGHKGARLTSQISLPGRFLVYVPDGTTSGISRKLPDTERNRLKSLLKEIVPESAGVIVRTAAEGASEEELTHDVERLTARWSDIEAKVAKGNAPALLYGEPDLTLKVVRDLFTEDFGKLVVSGDDAWDLVEDYVEHVAPDLSDRLERYDSEDDVFAAYRIDEQIAKGLDRKVWLPSGGSLIIDRTEAMTVVDVNTGKFTGSGGNLEETVTKNNLEAAEEIVRQLRLRDIGGIIVVDFIDMVLESNRDLVLRRMVECLGRDRTRHQVAEVTSLGLVQMTRKRIGTGLLEAFSENCEHCQGRGLIVHHEPVENRKRVEEEPRRGRRPRGRQEDERPQGNGGPTAMPSPKDIAAMARAHVDSDGEEGRTPVAPAVEVDGASTAVEQAVEVPVEQGSEPGRERAGEASQEDRGVEQPRERSRRSRGRGRQQSEERTERTDEGTDRAEERIERADRTEERTERADRTEERTERTERADRAEERTERADGDRQQAQPTPEPVTEAPSEQPQPPSAPTQVEPVVSAPGS
ncbi:Rne/Rng family ribonuclease [Nocardioides mesophilus]|uniref:Ribonuclease E n=1 Tax=Nocardioides mesophilus TaxID=433659 RepID=A0A7G9RCR2_9ACTN|nr:Rne/Rng family ribonuclease [Nocardioides mesophilus]QNN53387.1 Rne/Rng family ribonuclease [Nocardioides mesophilus]